MEQQNKPKARRGFARLTPERRREIAAMGGKAAQARGVGHRWDSAEAAAAGRMGAAASPKTTAQMQELGRRGGLKSSQNRDHMRKIGRVGAEARRRKAES